MNKKIAAIVLLLSIATVGAASARGGMGYGYGYNNYPQMQGYTYQQMDAETQAKMNTFYNETQDLRKQIVMKQAERQALIMGGSSDPASLSRVSGELFDLRSAMQEKARQYGLANYNGGRGFGRGMAAGGRGMGYGCRMW